MPRVFSQTFCIVGALIERDGKIADISFESGEPVISNIKNIDHEGLRLIEDAGFTPDDKRLVYSYADPSKVNGKMIWGNIYTSLLDGSDLKQMTDTQWLHEENPEFSSDGKRLTYFNENPGDLHLSGESSWSPDGSQIIFHKYDKSAKEYSAGKLYLLTFQGACGKL